GLRSVVSRLGKSAVSVMLATAIGLLSLSAASCVYWPFDHDEPAGPPLTPPLKDSATAADVADAVREAPALVESHESGEPGTHLPIDPATEATSPEYIPPVTGEPVEPLREGERIVRRTGQLVATGDGRRRLVFDDAGERCPLPAMIVLPNALLQAMERQVAAADEPPLFDVSGEVTRYRGEVFLMIRRAVVVGSDDRKG
ncbi:MAG: hypothetical protein ACOC95_08125, partial [Planctomycetota bacterium]